MGAFRTEGAFSRGRLRLSFNCTGKSKAIRYGNVGAICYIQTLANVQISNNETEHHLNFT